MCATQIDADPSVTGKTFAFASQRDLPFYFVSASDGTNVVRVCSLDYQHHYIISSVKYAECHICSWDQTCPVLVDL